VLLMLSAFVLAALTWTGRVHVSHVILLSAFNGLVSAFEMPGRQAFVVDMVSRDDLVNAIALNSIPDHHGSIGSYPGNRHDMGKTARIRF